MRRTYNYLFFSVFLFIFLSCSKTMEQQLQEYMEFYYPSSGQYTYEITFEWGSYVITTGPNSEDELHPDSELYRGYITMRPFLSDTTQQSDLPVYLITSKGEVWKTMDTKSIPENKTRVEITEEKTEYGTSTKTSTINSISEPVIDNFLQNKSVWQKYGMLKTDGKQSAFKAEN